MDPTAGFKDCAQISTILNTPLHKSAMDHMTSLALTVTPSSLLPNALVLANSFLAAHPQSRFLLIATDNHWLHGRVSEVSDPRCSVMRLSDLVQDTEVPRRLWIEWESHGQLKVLLPLVVQSILRSSLDFTRLIALAPWMWVHDDLGELVDSNSPWIVTPKVLRPYPPVQPSSNDLTDVMSERASRIQAIEHDSFMCGVYSMDVLSFSKHKSTEAVDWLSSRVTLSSSHPSTWLVGLQNPGEVERWLDTAVALFNATILRDPATNIAPWNLGERRLSRSADRRIRADGTPIRLTNHVGFDITRPWTARDNQDSFAPWDINENESAQGLWSDYAQEVRAAGEALGPLPSDYGAFLLADVPVSMETRRSSRIDHARARQGIRGAGAAFSGEHDAEKDLRWLQANGAELMHPVALPEQRALDALLTRDMQGCDGPRANQGARIMRLSRGVDVLGPLRSVSGLGAAARRYAALLKDHGVGTSETDYPLPHNSSELPLLVGEGPRFDILLAIVNGDSMPAARQLFGPREFDRRHVIGQWAWETERLPIEHRIGFQHVDEVWANSTFVRDVIRRDAPENIPVLYIPSPIEMPEVAPGVTREMFGLDDRLLFFFAFDHFSSMERKNPDGLIRAFREAFHQDDGAILLIKTSNGSKVPEQVEQLRWHARGRSDIVIKDGFVQPDVMGALFKLCDVYISLHRSEGLGYTMAEAMLLSKPVIATAYGGNLDFMSDESSLLISAQRVSSSAASGPYAAGSEWGEPDLDAAVAGLRKLANDSLSREALGRAGYEQAKKHFSRERVSRIVGERLSEIWSSI